MSREIDEKMIDDISDNAREEIVRAYLTSLVFVALKQDFDTLEDLSNRDKKHAVDLIKSDIDRIDSYWIQNLLGEAMGLVDWEKLMARIYRQFERDDSA